MLTVWPQTLFPLIFFFFLFGGRQEREVKYWCLWFLPCKGSLGSIWTGTLGPHEQSSCGCFSRFQWLCFTALFILGWNSLADGIPDHFSSDSLHSFHTKKPSTLSHSSVLSALFLRLGHIKPNTLLQTGDVSYHPEEMLHIWIPSCTVKCEWFWLSLKSVLQFFPTLLEGRAENISQLSPPLVIMVLDAFYIPCISDRWIIYFSALCFLLFLKQSFGKAISTENEYPFFISTSIW